MAFKCLSCIHIPFMLYVDPALNSKINITQFLLSSQNSITWTRIKEHWCVYSFKGDYCMGLLFMNRISHWWNKTIGGDRKHYVIQGFLARLLYDKRAWTFSASDYNSIRGCWPRVGLGMFVNWLYACWVLTRLRCHYTDPFVWCVYIRPTYHTYVTSTRWPISISIMIPVCIAVCTVM